MDTEDVGAMIAIAITEANSRVQAATASATVAAEATMTAANSQAQATRTASENHADASKYGAFQHAEAMKEAARINAEVSKSNNEASVEAAIRTAEVNAEATKFVAERNAQSAAEVGNIHANSQKETATIHADASRDVAEEGGRAQIESATIHADASREVATTQLEGVNVQAEASKFAATQRREADVQVAQIHGTASENVAGTAGDASMYGADKHLEGVVTASEEETTRLDKKLAFAYDRWREVFPLIEKWIGGESEGGSDGWADLVAAVGTAPYISAAGVWTPQQIQQQVNAIYARASQTSQSLSRRAEIEMSSRGLAASSPLLSVLKAGYAQAELRTSTEESVKLNLDASKLNREMVLKGQTAQQDQFASHQKVFVDLNGNAVQLHVGLFNGMATMLAGIA
jgi:hypothetical protein